MDWASQVAYVVKNLPASAGAAGDVSSIPGLGSSPGRGNGSSCQHSFQDNPKDREVWQAIVHGITKSWTRWRTLGGLSSSIGFCGAYGCTSWGRPYSWIQWGKDAQESTKVALAKKKKAKMVPASSNTSKVEKRSKNVNPLCLHPPRELQQTPDPLADALKWVAQ